MTILKAKTSNYNDVDTDNIIRYIAEYASVAPVGSGRRCHTVNYIHILGGSIMKNYTFNAYQYAPEQLEIQYKGRLVPRSYTARENALYAKIWEALRVQGDYRGAVRLMRKEWAPVPYGTAVTLKKIHSIETLSELERERDFFVEVNENKTLLDVARMWANKNTRSMRLFAGLDPNGGTLYEWHPNRCAVQISIGSHTMLVQPKEVAL